MGSYDCPSTEAMELIVTFLVFFPGDVTSEFPFPKLLEAIFSIFFSQYSVNACSRRSPLPAEGKPPDAPSPVLPS